MSGRKQYFVVPVFALVIVSILQGCTLLPNERSTEAQLERVAKDWCMTIRASQVLCVYPLTEDLQVGDLYIVSTSIDDEVQQYRERGFLPFDLLLCRLQPKGYEEMYRGFYNTRGLMDVIPHQWQFPANAAAGATDWTFAPGAAFPTYTFSIRRGEEVRLPLPVQSIAVGVAILNTGKATGSVAIEDASTYGVPVGILERQIDEWAQDPVNRAVLARYAPMTERKTGKGKQYFLRAIARAYVAGSVNVSLQRDDTHGAGAATDPTRMPMATTAPPASTTAPETPIAAIPVMSLPVISAPLAAGTQVPQVPAAATTNPATSAPATGTGISKSRPGGSIRIVAASSRSISMSETFARPLVVGYIGVDRPIGTGGILGPSVLTRQRVERRVTGPVARASE
jgi:hypothetical protein